MSDVSPMIGGCVLKAKRPRIHTQSQTSTGMHTCSKSSSSSKENATIRKSKVIRALLCELPSHICVAQRSKLRQCCSYPAGFIHVYTALHALTRAGSDFKPAQYVFAAVYVVTWAIVFRLYARAKVSSVAIGPSTFRRR